MSRVSKLVRTKLGFRWRRHRHMVGIPHYFDPIGRSQFELLKLLGLAPHHYVLDLGCGSLAAGKHLIPYLAPGHYCGIEPNSWLVADGIVYELGKRWINQRHPRFSDNDQFELTVFDQSFDFIVAHSIFSHAAQAQITKSLSQARQALKPEGIFVASYFKGQHNYEGEAWVYPGAVAYTPAKMAEMAGESGLTMKELVWPDLNQTWVAFFNPRAEPTLTKRLVVADRAANDKVIYPDPRGPAWFRDVVRRLPPALSSLFPRDSKMPGAPGD